MTRDASEESMGHKSSRLNLLRYPVAKSFQSQDPKVRPRKPACSSGAMGALAGAAHEETSPNAMSTSWKTVKTISTTTSALPVPYKAAWVLTTGARSRTARQRNSPTSSDG